MGSDKKNIMVSCAIIEKDDLVLAAQRSESMPMPLKWEFPGGKIHQGETPEDCLRRELMEELDVSISVKKALAPSQYEYSEFTVTLFPFVCSIISGSLTPHEHKAIAWATPEELPRLDWLPADLPVISAYLSALEK